MDEAGRLISELQQKLAQLDHKVCLYRQDMNTEFQKYADTLLRDVPKEVFDTVNRAIAESLKNYPLLDATSQDPDRPYNVAVNTEASSNCNSKNMDSPAKTITRAAGLHKSLESPTEAQPTSHEREQEFQGIFTPGYLPLLDSTDRNERRSSLSNASMPPSDKKPIDIVPQERLAHDTAGQPSSYPTSLSSLPMGRPPLSRRRSTDDGSNKSDHSDTPVRRSALRRTPSSSKPHSPRQVRFEFAGEEFLPTSSPKLEVPEIEFTPRSPIILGMGGTEELLEGLESPQVDDQPESPPKRITSSQALRLLSRGPLEDDGTHWTEVIAPIDGSASVPKGEMASENSDDESLSMRMSVTAAAPKLNGYKKQDTSARHNLSSNNIELPGRIVAYPKEVDAGRNGDRNPDEIAKEEDVLANMPQLTPVVANTNINPKSSSESLQEHMDKSQSMVLKSNKRPWFILPDGTDLNEYEGTSAKLNVDQDDEDMFAFDEAADQLQQKPPAEPDSEDDLRDSPVEENDGEQDRELSTSQFATSPRRPIPKAGSMVGESKDMAPSTPRRSSYHPFNTPIVNPALHEKALSLGNVPSFVGSVRDGLEEMALQSFRGGGSYGGVPRSLSERMAFDEAMEAQREAAKKT